VEARLQEPQGMPIACTDGHSRAMSFRNRLTSFFILIVLLPMVAIGLLTFKLIDDSNQGRATARANGVAATADSVYRADELAARADAVAVAQALAPLPAAQIKARLAQAAAAAGLVRVTVTRNGVLLADIGSPNAIAPGTARSRSGGAVTTVVASGTIASQYARSVGGPGDGVIVRQGGRTLASTASGTTPAGPIPQHVTLGGVAYASATNTPQPGFGSGAVTVTALSNLNATTSSVATSQLLAVAFLGGFVLLTFSFAVIASRGLERTVARFLRAAKQLAGGDFSTPVPVDGNDEFAQLAVAFNDMSAQLAERLAQLSAERQRLRDSIRRAGKTLESNLDPGALRALTLSTAVDGIEGDFGRLSVRDDNGPLAEAVREGSLAGVEPVVLEAEQDALRKGGLGEASDEQISALTVPLEPISPLGRPSGLITVGRHGHPFSDDDKDLLQSLVGQAALALDNVRLHQEVQRQAQTDLLTGLVNHGRFQAVLTYELEQVRRYHYPVGLIMIDIDDFKRVNDTYGHPQGDLVLHSVGRVLQETSREGDTAARYGGEEMAVILPHADIDGAAAIAERIRNAVEALEIPRLDGEGSLRVTTSVGVSASLEGAPEQLIADADGALYRAKREGKNRTVRATSVAANGVRSQ
jgi:diguanylate cyclase (GGDEF)-like protein